MLRRLLRLLLQLRLLLTTGTRFIKSPLPLRLLLLLLLLLLLRLPQLLPRRSRAAVTGRCDLAAKPLSPRMSPPLAQLPWGSSPRTGSRSHLDAQTTGIGSQHSLWAILPGYLAPAKPEASTPQAP